MSQLIKDPLLTAANVVICASCIALLIFVRATDARRHRRDLLDASSRRGHRPSSARAGAPSPPTGRSCVLVLIVGLFAACSRSCELLRQIVEASARGDPFEPENADRLSRMGWLAGRRLRARHRWSARS